VALPVLASDIPANQEWVREGVNGWLFPDGNADILAEKILAVMTQRKKLGRYWPRRPKVRRRAGRLEKEFCKTARSVSADHSILQEVHMIISLILTLVAAVFGVLIAQET